MVPNAAQFYKENEYEQQRQISTLPASQKQSPSGPHASQRILTNGRVNKRRGCITVCVFLTVLAVLTLTALAIGSLSFRASSNVQFAIADASQNYTYLMEEISAVKSLLSQLNLETERNISELDDKISSSGYSLSVSVSRLSTSAHSASLSINFVGSLPHAVYTVSSRAYWNSYSISWLSTSLYTASSRVYWNSYSVSRLSTSLNTASSRAYWNSYSVSRLSTNASRLYISLYTASSRVYWNSYSVSRLSTFLACCTRC